MAKGRQAGDGRGRMGGRQKGTPNKVTRPMRELLASFCEDSFKDFVKAFREVKNPADKCRIYLDAQAYVTPKLSSVDLKPTDAGKSLADELDEIASEEK